MNDVLKMNIFVRKGIREGIIRRVKKAREKEVRETGRKRSSESKTGYTYRCRAFSVRTLQQIRSNTSAKWISTRLLEEFRIQ